MSATIQHPFTTAHAAAEFLVVVAKSAHPKIDLPNLASNRGITLAEAQTFLNRAGYPDKQRLIATAQQLTGQPVELKPVEDLGITQLIALASTHPSKRIQTAGGRLVSQIETLRQLVADYRDNHAARDAARAEVRKLEAQLAKAKAKLRDVSKTSTKTTTAGVTQTPRGEYPCRHDGCTEVKDTPQARSVHEGRWCPHRPQDGA